MDSNIFMDSAQLFHCAVRKLHTAEYLAHDGLKVRVEVIGVGLIPCKAKKQSKRAFSAIDIQ